MTWLDFLIACASLAVALTAVRGRTWDEAKPGISALTRVGWVAVIAAVALLLAALAKAGADAREKDDLRDQLTRIATNTMVGLTQELDRENADMRLIPRVALFPATTLTVMTPALATGHAVSLAQALVRESASIEGGDVVVQMFGEDLQAKRDLAQTGVIPGPGSKVHVPHLYAARIDDSDRGPFAFNAVVQYGEARDTARVVQAIFDKKVRITIELRLRGVTDRAALEAEIRKKLATGFGYLRLSDRASPTLRFTLEAEEVRAQGIDPTVLRMAWQAGTVGGIRAQGCSKMGR